MNIEGNGGYAVGWITLSFINAGLAQAKGFNGGLSWLASIFLGPIVTFLIVITPPVAITGERAVTGGRATPDHSFKPNPLRGPVHLEAMS